jgi:hypothetical protein
VTPAAPFSLQFVQQPTNAVAGATITPAVTVQTLDQYGNICTNDNASVITMAIGVNPSGGVLSGTLIQVVVNGVATFNDLSINNAGVGYTLRATSPGLVEANSVNFNIITAGVAIWTGALSTDWNTGGNWNIGVVPNATHSVIIPLVANQPILATPVIIKDLTIYSGAILTQAGNNLSVVGNVSLAGTIDADSSRINIGGNFIATNGNLLSGINPILSVGGYIATRANPLNTNIAGTLTVSSGGMLDKVSISLQGSANYSFQENIPGFVFMNGRLVPHAGQASIRSTLETGESVAYKRNLAMPQPLMAPALIPVPVSIMVTTPAGPMPVAVTPAITMPLPLPPAPVMPQPVLPEILPPPIPTPAIPARVLFKEARVSAIVSGLSVPQTFERIRIYATPPTFLYFRDATIASHVSGVTPPNIFNNVKVFLQIH